MAGLHEVARELTNHPRFQNTPLVVKGGTGLALAYGLPRPSTDLDLTSFGRPDKERILRVAVEALSRVGGREFTRADVKQRGHGYIRLQWEDGQASGVRRRETKIDVSSEDSLARPKNTEVLNGFRTFSMRTLAQTKLNTLIGTQPRDRARDLYDAAWIMENHMEAVAPKFRIALATITFGSIVDMAANWNALFTDDSIMSRVSFDAVWDNLSASLDHDPIILFDQDPSANLVVEQEGGSLVLVFRGHDSEPTPIGKFDDQRSLSQWLAEIDPQGVLPVQGNTGGTQGTPPPSHRGQRNNSFT